ncbi:transposase family protein [Acidithiobacillus ferruginosus]|uniref:Transposase family protein n=1 Tax=Acidithiobacillus ferruginosus TaxID=3063951 RepID=A0ACD5IKE4_9PROT|nr:transposase family protein [Acidithiobacillus ferruginosus]MBU2812985.1 transposase family protein [Acidithiobacillus ferruginosus]
MQTVTLSDAQMEGLRQIFFRLPDTRSKLGKQHPLPAILTVAVAAVLTRAESYVAIAEWGGRLTQTQLKRIRARFNPRIQRYVAPSEPTIRRALQGADVEALDAAIGAWLLGAAGFEAVAVDGKVLKGAVRAEGAQVHLLSAFLHGQGSPSRKRKSPGKPTKFQNCAICFRTATSRARSSLPMPCIPSGKPPASSSKTKKPIISSPPSKAINENSATV